MRTDWVEFYREKVRGEKLLRFARTERSVLSSYVEPKNWKFIWVPVNWVCKSCVCSSQIIGSIHESGICKLKCLQVADFSSNYFEGDPPICLHYLPRFVWNDFVVFDSRMIRRFRSSDFWILLLGLVLASIVCQGKDRYISAQSTIVQKHSFQVNTSHIKSLIFSLLYVYI